MLSGVFLGSAFAEDPGKFDPSNAKISGWIKYSVLGRYTARFEEFEGRIHIDPSTAEITGVELKIAPASITSNCHWCDKIVKSEQLLAVSKYPAIEFKSNRMLKTKQGYRVEGKLSMHGVTRDLQFPFKDEVISKADGTQERHIQGEWEIQRKDFGITWNKLLDKGGVIVGNVITVQWHISSPLDNLKEDV